MFLVSSSDLTFVAGVAVTGLCWNYDTQEELFIFYSQCFFAGAMALVYLLCLLALLVVVLKAEELTLLLLPIDLLPQHIPFSRRRKKGDSKELQMTVCAYDRMKIGYYLAMQVFTTCVAWFAFHRHQYTAALLFHGSLSLMAILSEEFVWVHLFGCCCDKKVCASAA